MIRRDRLKLIPLVVACCATSTGLHAAGYPKEGRIDTMECMVAEGPRVESPAGVTFGGIVSHNVAQAPNGSRSPLDEYGTYCIGHYLEEKSGKSLALGVCEQTDADGDKWVLRFRDEGNQMAGTFEFVAGTGKYKDARISGQYQPAGPLFFGSAGHLQRCMRITGSYRLK